MADAGATQYTFHIEAAKDVKNLCRTIKESGMKVIDLIYFAILKQKNIDIALSFLIYFLK